MNHPHLTNSVITVKPIDFGYNEQTGADNEYQNQPKKSEVNSIRDKALLEFDACMDKLNQFGLETIVLDKTHTNSPLPDAIFPNNWLSTRADGSISIYPMKTPNRQDEVQIDNVIHRLSINGYKVQSTTDYRKKLFNSRTNNPLILEGTGSLIFHHPSNQLFAALSERCEQKAVELYSEEMGYQLNLFHTLSQNGNPVYHTNVLMSCGKDFAVITKDIIRSNEQPAVISKLENCISDLLIISEEQMSENFCGNILQLNDKNNQPIITMSLSAYKGFKPEQIKVLEKHGSLVVCDISTIEHIGGGSMRCMLAENFLPKS